MPTTPSKSTPPDTVGNDRGPLVLVVEDNEKNARMMVMMLESAGYATRWAEDGNVGLRLAADLQPALVLTDLQMPGMDGLAMTRALKSRKDTADIPVVAVTAHAMTDHCQQALAAGCSKFLTKPIRYKALLFEVADALQPRSA
jgi:two-component system cell cycle response regulator DivK